MDLFNSKKRGITYVEVISSLFIMCIIITLIYLKIPKGNNINFVANSLISELKYGKSLAIAKNKNVNLEINNNKNEIDFSIDNKVFREYCLPKEYYIDINLDNLPKGIITFKSDGTLGHGALTIKLKNESNQEVKITLTIGYTRIMRVD